MNTRSVRARLAGDRGSAVVEFPLMAVLIVFIALAVIQFALILHTRNTLTDAAVQAAYTASLLGNTPEDGVQRAEMLVGERLGASYEVEVSAQQATDADIEVEIVATLPLVGLLGPSGTLSVSGHAVAEESW